MFCKAYRQVEPVTYTAMQHLFWTWKGVFPPHPLRVIEAELDLSPKQSVPANSTQATRTSDASSMRTGHGIHVNPKYLEAQRQLLQQSTTSRVCFLPSNLFSIQSGQRSLRKLTMATPLGSILRSLSSAMLFHAILFFRRIYLYIQ